MARIDQTLTVRVFEVLHRNPAGMTAREALRQVLAERYRDDQAGLLEYAASVSEGSLRILRRMTYELEEEDPKLFDVPSVIAVSTSEGDLFVPRDRATLGQVRQWLDEGLQHHRVQAERFDRFRERVEPLESLPDETLWRDARGQLAADQAQKVAAAVA